MLINSLLFIGVQEEDLWNAYKYIKHCGENVFVPFSHLFSHTTFLPQKH